MGVLLMTVQGDILHRLRTKGDLPGHNVLQEVEKSHPDLLQLSQDLEPPSQAAGWVFLPAQCLSSSGPNL